RRKGIFTYQTLNNETFLTLPGVLADSLPDRFGNALIDAWLAQSGRSKADFTPVERLCYVGSRGMGALEFKPSIVPQARQSVPIEVARLTELAQKILDERENLNVSFKDREAVNTIFRIGTSAGGARPKALIAWNRKTNEVRSGQVPPPEGFEPWILKFDGVKDEPIGDSQGYGRIEYAYNKMALDAGITMMECRLFEEGGRAHFMTRRFDRSDDNQKLHMQSLCGLAHLDYRLAGSYGYEQAFSIIAQLNLGHPALAEMFRRMVFNVVSRNQDDHTRNIAFLMDQNGPWRLSPAFDMIWAYNPSGTWTNQHQMSIQGKRDNFKRSDLLEVGKQFGIKDANSIVDKIVGVVERWPTYAADARVPRERIDMIGSTHRLKL
ncbi:MAG TPA: type II toxin-antitoxin system HipA family toxin, partial [Bacteroidota bacterium]